MGCGNTRGRFGEGAILFNLDAGIALAQDAPAVGETQTGTLPPYRCAALLLWGGLAHTGGAYDLLRRGVTAAGLQSTGECRSQLSL